jgi:hypothetical protein
MKKIMLVVIAVTYLVLFAVVNSYADDNHIVIIDKVCESSGIGIGNYGVSKTNCHYICLHYEKVEEKDYKLVKVEKCDPKKHKLSNKEVSYELH